MGIHAGGNTRGVWGWFVFVEVPSQHAGVLGVSAHPSLTLLPQQPLKIPLKPRQTTVLIPDLLVLLVPERMKRVSLGCQRDPEGQKLLEVGCNASLWP